MGFSRRLAYYMVHTLGFTNKDANALISSGKVELDGLTVHENCFLEDTQTIAVNGKIVREAKKYIYLKFNKPRGFQSTLNSDVADNLSGFFKGMEGLAIAGRLDKESEGLLLLSNDGKWIEKICNPDSEKEKEYLVELSGVPDEEFCRKFSEGVLIGKHFTRPCQCEIVSGHNVRIVLTEGKNRQIRRMAKKLGFEVLSLKRIKVDMYDLADLDVGHFEMLSV